MLLVSLGVAGPYPKIVEPLRECSAGASETELPMCNLMASGPDLHWRRGSQPLLPLGIDYSQQGV